MSAVFSIRFKNYKCFTEETTISNIKKVNLLIGRNNCGKTSALEVISFVLSKEFESKSSESNLLRNSVIEYKTKLEDDIYSRVFPKGEYLGLFYSDSNSINYLAKDIKGSECFYPIYNSNYVDAFYEVLKQRNSSVFSQMKWGQLANAIKNNIKKHAVYRIASERDVTKETRAETSEPEIESNGSGITQYIERCLNLDKGDYKLIKNSILDALNEILKGESHYSNIDVLDNGEELEIYLYENDRRIPLSQMGSGLKTIIFVLLQLYRSEKDNNTKRLFLFEELENNLHPEIQRRLLNFIYDFVTEKDDLVFITSHSHVAINCFYNKNDTSIFHVYKKENGSSSIDSIENSADKASILNDLGVLASDIFQSNGIIWVEGPSDRVYIKKWLAIKYPELRENEHYTFLYYGGKNLAHFTADDKNEKELIDVLLTNRNGLIVMDHDEDSPEKEVRETKKRVKEEFEKHGKFVWVTKGKEIENYLKAEDIKISLNLNENAQIKQVAEFEPFKEYIFDYYKNFENQKVSFSQKMVFNPGSLKRLDLEEKIDEIAKNIKRWNGID